MSKKDRSQGAKFRAMWRPASFEELLAHARAGDPGALAELFRRSQKPIQDLASQQVSKARPGSPRPSDIAQETAKRAFEKLPTFKGTTEAEWKLWLQRVLESRVNQWLRDAHRDKRNAARTISLDQGEDSSNLPEVHASERSPSQAIAHHEEQHRLQQRLVAHLHDLGDQGEAIWHHHLKDLPVAEVAQIMGKTQQALGGLLQRGLKALKTRMQDDGAAHAGDDDANSTTSVKAASAFLSYRRQVGAGQKVDREAFLAEHPECADELRDLLEWVDRLEAIWTAPPKSR